MDKLLRVTFITGIALVIIAISYKLYLMPHDHGERLLLVASGEYDHLQFRARLLAFAGFALFFGSMIAQFIIAKLNNKRH